MSEFLEIFDRRLSTDTFTKGVKYSRFSMSTAEWYLLMILRLFIALNYPSQSSESAIICFMVLLIKVSNSALNWCSASKSCSSANGVYETTCSYNLLSSSTVLPLSPFFNPSKTWGCSAFSVFYSICIDAPSSFFVSAAAPESIFFYRDISVL